MPRKPALGVRHRGLLRVSVAFDDDTFAQVTGMAARDGISFAEAVRRCVEWGLMDAEGEGKAK